MDLKALIAKMDQIEAKRTLMEAGDPAAYADAQQKMANLEKAAKYTGDDPIVRSRMGLPPKLPPIDQWDGKQPAPVGKPDWVAQLTTLGGAGQAQAGAVKQNAAIDSSNAFIKDKLGKLNALVAQLQKLSAAPAAGAPVAKESIQFKGAIAKVLGESFGYKLMEADPAPAAGAAAGAAAGGAAPAAAPAGGGKEDIIKQIQAIMAELGDNENPTPEVADALSKAQAAIDAANKAPATPATPGAGQPGGPDEAAKLKRFEELIAKLGATGGVSGSAPAPAAKKPAGGATQPAKKPAFNTGIAPQVKMPGMSQQQNDALSMMAAGNMGA
jgi:hypothetical protein